MKSTVLTTYTPYPSRKIRRIHALNFTQHPLREDLYAVSTMHDQEFEQRARYTLRRTRTSTTSCKSNGESTIEEYMTKTREDYGSGIVRPKIDEKARFELKGQFLKELCDNTFSGTNEKDVVEHIETFLEIVDSLDIPNVTHDQLRLSIFPVSLNGATRK
ncbi:hypothetical protein Tco_0404658 [Tanacetum coccineum]